MKKNAPFLVRLVIFCLWPIIALVLLLFVTLVLIVTWFMFFSERFVITRGTWKYYPSLAQRILLTIFWPIIAPVLFTLSAGALVLAWPVTLFKVTLTLR